MSLRLFSIAFSPRGQRGWSAGPFSFSESLTVLEGPNGAGKTPILKGLAYCLGYPIQLPPEILTHCAAVVLELVADTSRVGIERFIGVDFHVAVTRDSEVQEFKTAKDFSQWLISAFGIQDRSLATRDGGVTATYTDFLVPMFWIDQDLGWRDLYSPLSTRFFVKDQAEEIIRLLLNLPGRNNPVDKNEYAAALVRLEATKQRLEIKRQVLQSLEKTVLEFGPLKGADELTEQRGALMAELTDMNSVLEALSTKASAFDELISTRRTERDAAQFGHRAAVRRLDELRVYGKTLDAQVSVVEANEVAADAFRILCGNQACQFFRQPEESYGRRVLYIKDQIKDFESSLNVLREEIDKLQTRVGETERALRRALDQKQVQSGVTSGTQIVQDVDRITREFATVSAQLLQTKRLETERSEFNKLVDLFVSVEDAAQNLKPTRGPGRDDSAAWDAANELGEFFVSWLSTLNTPNLPQQKHFDERFSLFLGGVRFSENSSVGGSTRTRVVLAFHAALLELSLKRAGKHPQMLILDTPKQHELHSKDLKAFVNRFLELRQKYSVDLQLVVAATELEFLDTTLQAEIWHPYFRLGVEPRFFGRYLPSDATAYEETS